MGRLSAEGDHDFGDAGPGFPRFLDTLAAFGKPVIAAVNGIGVGIGMTMLLHVDLALISTTARLRAPFVPLGVVPEAAGSLLMPVVMGNQRAALKLYTGDWITADEAVEYGLAFRAVDARRVDGRDDGPRPAYRQDAGRVTERDEARGGREPHRRRPSGTGPRRPGLHRNDRPPREHGGDHRVPREAGTGLLPPLTGFPRSPAQAGGPHGVRGRKRCILCLSEPGELPIKEPDRRPGSPDVRLDVS